MLDSASSAGTVACMDERSRDMFERLNNALARYSNVPELVAVVRRAIGVARSGPLAASRIGLVEFLFQPTDEVFTAFLLGERQFVVAQMDRNEATLLVAVPVSRIRRVALFGSSEQTTLTVELDADQSRFVADTQSQASSATGPLSQEQGTVVGMLQPSAYVVSAPPVDRDDLVRFADALRLIVLG